MSHEDTHGTPEPQRDDRSRQDRDVMAPNDVSIGREYDAFPPAPDAGYSGLAGYTAESGWRYRCPHGDFTWSRETLEQPVPQCPTHHVALEFQG